MKSENEIRDLLNQIGENADAETQFALAHSLKDKEEAIKWYRKAADQGNTDALVELGLCYLDGDGVEYSEEKGLTLLQEAADQGEAEALSYMGNYYIGNDLEIADMEGSKEDIEKGITCYQQAAEKGDPSAQENVLLLWIFTAKK